jgi:hypothetical protein
LDLIVAVEIARRVRHSRYESHKDDDLGFIPPSCRLYLIRADGSVCSI